MPRPLRAIDLGIRVGRFTPGPTDGITDVAGVRVAATTIVAGDGAV
jgi:L-aminopeptidase/D-esterase-like protein